MQLIDSLVFTFHQAFLSALFSLTLGILGALGLICYSPGKRSRVIEILVLLPNTFPILFLILATLNFVHWVANFPYGMWGIVLVHVLMNLGLVAQVLSVALRKKLGGVLELCLVEGASYFDTLIASLMNLKSDIKSLFFSVFSLCFASFAVPMIVGRGFQSTIEMLIYEKIKVDYNLLSAAGLVALQIFILFVLSRFFKPSRSLVGGQTRNMKALGVKFLSVFAFLPTIVLVSGLLFPLTNTTSYLGTIQELWSELWPTILVSFGNALFTGVLIYFLFLILLYFYPARRWRSGLYGLAAPSTVFFGFLLFLIGPNENTWAYFKIALGLAIISLPILYRMLLATEFLRLISQYEVALICGGSRNEIFKKILWPQMHRHLILAAQVGSLWAVGDFALSSVIAQSSFTLPLVVKDLLVSYQLDLAVVLCWVLVLIGASAYLLLAFIGRTFAWREDT